MAVDDDDNDEIMRTPVVSSKGRIAELQRNGGTVNRGSDSGHELPAVTSLRPSNDDSKQAAGTQLPAKVCMSETLMWPRPRSLFVAPSLQ